jgi:hypothetical protein
LVKYKETEIWDDLRKISKSSKEKRAFTIKAVVLLEKHFFPFHLSKAAAFCSFNFKFNKFRSMGERHFVYVNISFSSEKTVQLPHFEIYHRFERWLLVEES